jgi:geranylgeranyl pyrophosphate synthase
MIATITLLDPAMEKLHQVEELLVAQVDEKASPFEAALAGLIAAGGKRLRPHIALLVGGALGVNSAALLNLAAAIEMLHTATLIHDDIVDGSMLRRGVETLNARWSAAVSVLVGDLAFTRAAGLIHNTRSFPVIEMFTRTMSLMVEGEGNQLVRERGLSNRDDYFHWIGAKTAALFELAAGVPALLSPAGEETFAAARRFGYEIGMAFQIVDDVLDFTGDPARMGKPVGNDLFQGVMTLPALIYLEGHPGDPELRAVLQRESPGRPALEGLIERICRSVAIDRSLEAAHGFVLDALEDLTCLPAGPERFALAEIALDIDIRDK